jgi:hypothetical protein
LLNADLAHHYTPLSGEDVAVEFREVYTYEDFRRYFRFRWLPGSPLLGQPKRKERRPSGHRNILLPVHGKRHRRRIYDLVLMGLGEIRVRRAIGIDDNAFGQKVQHPLSLVFWLIGGEKVVEAAILADDDDDDVLDRGGSLDRVALVIQIVSGSGRCAKAKKRYSEHEQASSGFRLPFSRVTKVHIFLQVEVNLEDV